MTSLFFQIVNKTFIYRPNLPLKLYDNFFGME